MTVGGVASAWYGRQFGEAEQFALVISLSHDAHPTGHAEMDGGWGGFALWVRGRCLTRNVSSESGILDEIRWNLKDILRWFAYSAVRLVNEEPFPLRAKDDQVRDACDWVNSSDTPFPSLTEHEEDDWFDKRSDWRRAHALRRSAEDVVLPNVVIRRLGQSVEVSWDNETWGVARPDVSFVERRGTELVPADIAAGVLREALAGTLEALTAKYNTSDVKTLAEIVSKSVPAAHEWRWLVHRDVADIIQREMPDLRIRLDSHVQHERAGWYIPHTFETLALRQAHLSSAREIEALLKVASPPHEPIHQTLRALVKPKPAMPSQPWVEGYDLALELREEMGWDDEPLPDLSQWLRQQRVVVREADLAASVAIVSTRSSDYRAATVLNRASNSRLKREIGHAAGLAHVLFDTTLISVDGVWEHWPSAARARAFGVMLLLPIAGVRDLLSGKSDVDSDDVERLMRRFHTGPYATTYHLKNQGFIDEERRVEILRELAS